MHSTKDLKSNEGKDSRKGAPTLGSRIRGVAEGALSLFGGVFLAVLIQAVIGSVQP
jgi:hypothetical protein